VYYLIKLIQPISLILLSITDPPTVRLEPESEEITVELNEMVEIECLVDGVPKPIISWTSLVRIFSFIFYNF